MIVGHLWLIVVVKEHIVDVNLAEKIILLFLFLLGWKQHLMFAQDILLAETPSLLVEDVSCVLKAKRSFTGMLSIMFLEALQQIILCLLQKLLLLGPTTDFREYRAQIICFAILVHEDFLAELLDRLNECLFEGAVASMRMMSCL